MCVCVCVCVCVYVCLCMYFFLLLRCTDSKALVSGTSNYVIWDLGLFIIGRMMDVFSHARCVWISTNYIRSFKGTSITNWLYNPTV